MKLKISAIAALAGLLLFASACAGIAGGGSASGMPVELPGIESGLTEAGNPTEEETEIKGLYINEEFGVRVEYPTTWDIEEKGSEEAKFFSSDESITAQFVWLEDDQSFDDFIIETRGGFENTRAYIDSPFDATVCVGDDLGSPEDGMIVVECYHYNVNLKGRSVIIESGFVGSETGSSVIFRPDERSEAKGKSLITASIINDKPEDDEGSGDRRLDREGSKVRKPILEKTYVRRQHLRRAE